jgi:arylsulfatase A
MILTHCPFVPTPDSADWNPQSPGSPTYKGNPKYFGDMVRYMDKLVGRIVAKVEALGLSGRTVILFTGDNGTDQPVVSRLLGRDVAGGKGRSTDAGTRVPLIASAPGLIPPRVVSDLVDFTDFLPTLCNLANIETAPFGQDLDGRSFLPQLLGEKGSPRTYVYSWYQRAGRDRDATVFARNQRYKLYRDGRYIDVTNDVDEKHPLVEESLSPEQRQTKVDLQAVIDRYAQYRQPR